MQFKKLTSRGGVSLVLLLILTNLGWTQDQITTQDQYQIGPDQRLLITVHIFGEVQKPGEYLVPDDTNILEIISKAGGPTEYANLDKVKITRGLIGIGDLKNKLKQSKNKNIFQKKSLKKQVIRVYLKKILNNVKYQTVLPNLHPGDVVIVGRNSLFTWQAIFRGISQLAIIAQLWYWYSRTD